MKGLTKSDDDRGMVSARTAVALVVAITVTALVAAFLLPVAVNELEGTTTATYNQSVGSTVEVNGALNSTLDSTNTTDGTATYTLNTSDGQSITKTISQGSNATYSFNRGDVVVTVNDVGSDYGDATYEYPKEFAFGDGARSIWGILGLAIVLAVFLAVLSIGLSATNRV